jgi:hypothetical protein
MSTIVYKGIVIRRKKRKSVVCRHPRHATNPVKPSRMRVIIARLAAHSSAAAQPRQRPAPVLAGCCVLISSFRSRSVFHLLSLPETRIHDHGVPLGAAEQILDVDVVEVLLLWHAIEGRLLLMGPTVWHPTHVRLLLLLR